jgi:mycothiol synthase
LQVSNFSSDRLPALLDFVEGRSAWGDRGRALGRRTFQQILGQPGLSPTDNCFLLEEGDRVRGFCLVVPETPIGRAVLELEVEPKLAGSVHQEELVRRAVGRVRELGVQVVHTCLPGPSSQASLLRDEGFSLIRIYWDLVWSGEALPNSAVPDEFRIRPFQPGDAAALTEVQNAAFGDSWGFCPNTVEQIEYRSLMVNIPQQGIMFLRHGEKTAGYCWTCLAPVDGSIRGVIGMIGVVPEYRGRGISRYILLAGMEFLLSLDVAAIGLQVDQDNAPAIRLYASVGFEKAGERHWFERGVSPDATPNR